MYANPRESLYRNIDDIEAVLCLKGDPKEARKALKKLILSTKNTHDAAN
jgi:hypothetical protein